jgi:hypothetical protein
MRRNLWVVVACAWLGSSTAFADDGSDAVIDTVIDLASGTPKGQTPPRFAFTYGRAFVAPRKLEDARPSSFDALDSSAIDLGLSEDGKAAWFAADLRSSIPEVVGNQRLRIEVHDYHASGVLEKVGADWQWVTWHIAEGVPASEQQQALKKGKVPPEIPRSIAGAEDVVKLFEATIGAPKALATTVSPDQHVRLYGSEHAESVTGGAAVRKRLERWGLVLKVRDGVQAGMVAGNHVAYVAANVDAVPQKRPKARAEPYRLLFVYARTAQGWQLVQAHFSVVT